MRSKSRLHTSTIRWHEIYTTIKKREEWKQWINHRLALGQNLTVETQNSPMSVVNMLIWLWFTSFAILQIHTKLWMVPCFVSKSLWQISHGSGISNTLPSSTKLRVCFHSFIQWHSMPMLQGLLCHKPGFQGSLVSGRKIPWPLNCCILHNSKVSTMLLTLPSSVTQLEWNLPTLNHICNNFCFLSFSIKIKFLGNFFSGYGLDLRAPLPLFQCYSVPSLMMLLS